ncbi:hypothetical protein Tco_0284851 [Tanacetum coccineum]
MSNSNTNLQTQSSNALHNAIMEAGSKDRPPMLAPGNYVQWKSRIKRYIDTKPNRELIHYSLQNPQSLSKGREAETVPVAEGRIDNDIYSTVDACPNACEMWKAIERLKQGESINVQDLETNLYWEFGKFQSRDGESLLNRQCPVLTLITTERMAKFTILHNHPTQNINDFLHRNATDLPETEEKAIVNLLSYYDPELLRLLEDEDNVKEKEIDKSWLYFSLVQGRSTNLPTTTANIIQTQSVTPWSVVQKVWDSVLQNARNMACFRECQKPKRVKDAAYHKEKMLLCKQEEAGVQLNAEQDDWKDDTDDESEE